jgi:hypothetical protein
MFCLRIEFSVYRVDSFMVKLFFILHVVVDGSGEDFRRQRDNNGVIIFITQFAEMREIRTLIQGALFQRYYPASKHFIGIVDRMSPAVPVYYGSIALFPHPPFQTLYMPPALL